MSASKRQAVEGLSGVLEVGRKPGEEQEETVCDLHANNRFIRTPDGSAASVKCNLLQAPNAHKPSLQPP